MTELELQRLKTISNSELHQSTLFAVKNERSAAMVVVHHLREVDRRRMWSELPYESLFEYCVKALRYSEGQAYRRISALKLIREIPDVEEKIVNGELNLTTIGQVQKFFRQESKERNVSKEEKHSILNAISCKTQKEVEVEFARLSPKAPKPDFEKSISHEFTQNTFAADRELSEKFQQLRMRLGHKISIDANYNEFFNKVCDLALQKLEPRQRSASSKRSRTVAKKKIFRFKREYIPIEIRRAVWVRDQSQCAYIDPFGNAKCACRNHLEIDHIIPIAKGGDNSLDNLRLLCKAHNQWSAIQEFGAEKMKKYLPGLS